MAKIEISGAFVNDVIGDPAFVLKVAETHSRKTDDGYEPYSRSFYDVKVSQDSEVDLSLFSTDDRVDISGFLRTEVREYEGKKFYTPTIWAEEIALSAPAEKKQRKAPAKRSTRR